MAVNDLALISLVSCQKVEDVWLGRKKDSREGTMTRKRSVADLGNGNMADANKRAMVADQLRSQTASPSATPEMQVNCCFLPQPAR